MSKGATALVTGATSGIGRATAVGLAAAGFNVVACGRREERLRAVSDECADANGPDSVLAIACDVTDEAAVAVLFERARAQFGRIDVVFNNAGLGAPAAEIGDTTFADFKRVVDVNLNGAYLIAREAFRHMKAQDPQGGRIINNGSISAYVPRPHGVAYNATKHAVSGLTKTISLDGRPYNIACGQIDIGNAGTDMTTKMADGVLQPNGSVAPEPTFDVQHVVDAVVYMARLPLGANVQSMTVMATAMPYVGRG